jgi:hypothetical protein
MEKYENLAVVVPAFGDFKVLAFVSGNSKAEVIRKVKSNSNIRGLVSIDHEDFPQKVRC